MTELNSANSDKTYSDLNLTSLQLSVLKPLVHQKMGAVIKTDVTLELRSDETPTQVVVVGLVFPSDAAASVQSVEAEALRRMHALLQKAASLELAELQKVYSQDPYRHL